MIVSRKTVVTISRINPRKVKRIVVKESFTAEIGLAFMATQALSSNVLKATAIYSVLLLGSLATSARTSTTFSRVFLPPWPTALPTLRLETCLTTPMMETESWAPSRTSL